jgi:putative nucleotidyltransferase with HDIG domain
MEDLEKQEIFDTVTKHLLYDEKPSEFIKALSVDKRYDNFPFTMLWKLKTIEQSTKYHPEGSVWNHTMMVLDEAAKVRAEIKDKESFMWSALLHDIGKADTTRIRHGKITSYDHDKAGEKLTADFLTCFSKDREFVNRTAALVRYHMHMLYINKKLPYADNSGLLKRVDAETIALLCRCDRLGRQGVDAATEESEYLQFLENLRKMKDLH